MRKEIIVKSYSTDPILISDTERTEGIKVVLVDDKNAPLARYEFEKSQLLNKRKIRYSSSNVRIKFIDIIPSLIYELQTVCE